METENEKLGTEEEYEARKRNASSRYMEDTRKQYLLASNNESLQALIENQEEELTRVLIELKSEYDLLTRESSIKKELIDEYNKKINMIQHANNANEKRQEEQKESTNHIKQCIELKKNKKEEELYSKKTLMKQVDKLNKDLFIIQKQIVKCENESVLLEKKKERAKLDENIIKEKGNQVYSKIEQQNQKNQKNKNENDLQVQYYETVIRQKYLFMQFADERKERQKKIEQEAKNDAQDKQEVEKRRKLQLLMLYNQFLRTRMNDQLKRYEELEDTYEKIRDICGTQDLEFIIDFVMLRNKRYNYAVQIIDEKERKIKKLRRDINTLNSDLIKLKNDAIINERDQGSRTETTVENSGMEQEEIEMMKKENEKNQELLVLGKKYNDINLAYKKVLENIQYMKDYDQAHPMGIKKEELKLEEQKKMESSEEDKKEEEANKAEGKEQKKNINLTKEEEKCFTEYEEFLDKILKEFKVLYLCKPKQEFLNLMKEKGIKENQQARTDTKKRTRTKRKTKKGKTNINASKAETNKNNDEEDDISGGDPDKKILAKFIKEQKKEIDEFINVKKPTNAPKPTQGK